MTIEKLYQNKKPDKGEHYRFEYKGIKLDPARICLIYGANHPLQQCIIKKSLKAGARGKKSLVEDIDDIICACERWKEMIEEDNLEDELKQEVTELWEAIESQFDEDRKTKKR